LTKSKKRRDPGTAPCDTPLTTTVQVEHWPLIMQNLHYWVICWTWRIQSTSY